MVNGEIYDETNRGMERFSNLQWVFLYNVFMIYEN